MTILSCIAFPRYEIHVPFWFLVILYEPYILQMAIYVLMQSITMTLVIRFKLWKIKHENTAWHGQVLEDEELDIPDWDDVRGVANDAYLMNQRITSDTFRHKFMSYNRSWLVSQLPSLLTPRTLRRSRPYLINQFGRIIGNKQNNISDDSDIEKPKFRTMALNASSRSIVRLWLGKARKRLMLKSIVQHLVVDAKRTECEVCMSRQKVQFETVVDIDRMCDIYDDTYPGENAIDPAQWKKFWILHQKYHNICLG